ncbi:uncharacterized protein LOC117301712 [Asterias rubens]|uniref:uncharacterized protein LOC117301712 n=1 Tax=Asterias rubens TaxID=7604 RepID=UPI001455499D|nr:uncharacterized protein LOC117301712 [Asterias rubens]
MIRSRTFLQQQDVSGRSKTARLAPQSIYRPTTAANASRGHNETTVVLPMQITDITKPTLIDVDADTNVNALYDRLVIVTAISDNHIVESMGMIKSAQTHMPDKQIYVYNLGLNKKNIQKLNSVCNVHVRGFDFSKYPPHVRNLNTMVWKVVIMRETLAEFGTIFYGDASVRFKGPLSKIMPYLYLHHGFMAHLLGFDPKITGEIPHYYYMTHEGMFKEMGLDKNDFYNVTKSDAPYFSFGRLLLANSTVLWEKLLNPVLECALKPQCIAPEGSKRNNHHYDQSLAAIVIYKNMRNEWTEDNHHTKQYDTVIEIKRSKNDGDGVKMC